MQESLQGVDRIFWVGRGTKIDPDDYIGYVGWHPTDPKIVKTHPEIHVSQWDFLREYDLVNLLSETGAYLPDLDKDPTEQEERIAFFEFLSGLANATGKTVDYCDTYKDFGINEREFQYRTWPGVTLEQRRQIMAELARSASNLLGQSPNVTRVFLHGSFGEKNPYAKDVDLFIAGEKRQLFSGFWDTKGIANFLRMTECDHFPYTPTQLINPDLAFALDQLADQAGIKLDIVLLPKRAFGDNPCCDQYEDFIEEIKEENRLYP